jgi:hypothetical protein
MPCPELHYVGTLGEQFEALLSVVSTFGPSRDPEVVDNMRLEEGEGRSSWDLVVSSREYPADVAVQRNPSPTMHDSDLPKQFMRVRAYPAFSPFPC